jgi:hypothetical protein
LEYSFSQAKRGALSGRKPDRPVCRPIRSMNQFRQRETPAASNSPSVGARLRRPLAYSSATSSSGSLAGPEEMSTLTQSLV